MRVRRVTGVHGPTTAIWDVPRQRWLPLRDSFATAMSSEVVTADEIFDDLAAVRGEVSVDGQRWASGSASDFVHSPQECVERASAGETVRAGELFSTGTLAGCSGIELRRLPPPGARVTLRVEQIGSPTNKLGGS